ncbi:MAG TPA: ATP-dependent zinc metalloprotease FtsH [Oscillospiraceae bacterium]|nr:ATP-dependent zinc metalloprotease FtsH [Oscillospiraceae bacterium]HPK35372.1 ATP-dependent zinc metalloprotease FtsH [Oscillospiraceae bacterium]HPR76198.1 ATP-dependent zinc metalloprotease FtsH [Oscillospiraceae bacterium]
MTKFKRILVYGLVCIGILLMISWMINGLGIEEKNTYSQILNYFQDDQVASHTLDFGTGELKIVLKSDPENEITYKVASITLFLEDTAQYRADAVEYNATTEGLKNPIEFDYTPAAQTAWWVAMIPYVLLFGAMFAFYYFMMRQQGGDGRKIANFGKARYKTASDEKRKVTFDDVAGEDEEKEELTEVVEFLKNPGQYTALGARVPKGVLLVGPPGTGKTLLARAVAGEAGVQFFAVSGSDFVEMYVGMGASRVRDLFEQAKKNLPCIIFIDEIDAVGRRRGAGLGGGHDEREQTLNQILVEMDGFGINEGVVIIAATNRPDVLDPALLRAGRFDRQIVVSMPDMVGREAVLKVHAKNKPLAPDVNLENIAKTTVGFSPADLENILNESALLAARRKHKAITNDDIEDAKNKVMMGPEKRSRKVTDKDRKLTAYHEGGHAIVSYFLPNQDPVHEISIIPRGMAGGYTMYLPTEDKSFVTKNELLEDVTSMLGGRVAEALMLDDISTGASNDIQRATQIARTMVTKYGFSEKLGAVCYDSGEEVFLGRDFTHTQNVSESVAAQIDEEIHNIINSCFARAREILSEHTDILNRVAERLLADEKISGEDFRAMFTTPAPEPGL